MNPKDKILSDYYQNVYNEYLFGKSIQARGIVYFEKQLEKFWQKNNYESRKVSCLEIGAGNGEHLKYVDFSNIEKYTCLDLREARPASIGISSNYVKQNNINFIVGNAQAIPFAVNSFDRVLATCLLHHVDEPLQVMLEARRVTKPLGEIAYIIPTDPGLLNRIVKTIISNRKIRTLTDVDPKLIYALEHKNHVGGIIQLLKFAYKRDRIEMRFLPFRVKSWNLNLLVAVHIIKSEN